VQEHYEVFVLTYLENTTKQLNLSGTRIYDPFSNTLIIGDDGSRYLSSIIVRHCDLGKLPGLHCHHARGVWFMNIIVDKEKWGERLFTNVEGRGWEG